MIDDPHVGLGHVLIAIAEPHAEGLDAYHRWFERDHMYSAVLVGPGAFAAERYVATRDLKALRYPEGDEVFPATHVGSFVALYYLVENSAEEHFAWSYRQSARLTEAGRSNRDRDLVLTWLCDFRGAVARDPDSIPAEIALDHRYDGLVMAWLEADASSSPAQLENWLRSEHLPEALADSTIDQVQIFAPRDFPDAEDGIPITPGSIAPNPWAGRGLLLLYFLESGPTREWDRYFKKLGGAIAAAGHGRVALLAPFLPVVRGGRRYLDALW